MCVINLVIILATDLRNKVRNKLKTTTMETMIPLWKLAEQFNKVLAEGTKNDKEAVRSFILGLVDNDRDVWDEILKRAAVIYFSEARAKKGY